MLLTLEQMQAMRDESSTPTPTNGFKPSADNLGTLKGPDLVSAIQRNTSSSPQSGVMSYLNNAKNNISNIPENTAMADFNLAKDLVNTPQKSMDITRDVTKQVWDNAPGALKLTAPIVGGVAGTANMVASGVGDTLGLIYQPLTQTAAALAPKTGNKYADSAIQQGLIGSSFSGPSGAVFGTLLGLTPMVTDAVKNIPDVKNYIAQHPEMGDLVDKVANASIFAGLSMMAQNTGGNGKPDILHQPVSEAIPEMGQNLKDTAMASVNATANLANSAVNSLTEKPISMIRSQFGGQNVNPQLETSAQRLSSDEASNLYKQYADQAEAHKNDIKIDKPAEAEGEQLGNAFDKVVQQRRDVGQAINQELKTVGNIPTDIVDAKQSILNDLADKNLKYDEAQGVLKADGQTPLGKADRGMVEDYVNGLHELGDNPTVKDLNSFMQKVNSELDLYKNQNNITGTTPAEAIIKQNLFDLRKQFTPEVNGDQLSNFSQLRSQYSDLSDFIKEGEKYLGKETQSGDFQKDASLIKSSVNSLLNNGKKDWMMKLEDLTGYKALDRGIIALQAMKDAGDTQASSLLDVMANGTPTPQGIGARLLGWAGGKIANMAIGSPREQTQAFLDSLRNLRTDNQMMATTPQTNPNINSIDNNPTTPTENTQGNVIAPNMNKSFVENTLDSHLKSTQMILQENPKAPLQEVLQRAQTNIADQFDHGGKPELANIVRDINPKDFDNLGDYSQAVRDAILKDSPAMGQIANYTKASMDTTKAFENSGNQKILASNGGVDFSIGDFGLNSLDNKITKGDRLNVDQIKQSIPNITEAYRASDDPSNYRYDNIAWVAKTPDSTNVIYTRLNRLGQEEILNAHKVSDNVYINTIKKFGAPDRNRTGIASLEEKGSIH